jgi:hypothetical protein
MMQREDHQRFLNALREVLGLGPLFGVSKELPSYVRSMAALQLAKWEADDAARNAARVRKNQR